MYKIMNPERDLVVLASSAAVDLYQLPEKSASVYASSDFLLFGVRIKTLSLVFRKYLTMCSTIPLQRIAHTESMTFSPSGTSFIDTTSQFFLSLCTSNSRFIVSWNCSLSAAFLAWL